MRLENEAVWVELDARWPRPVRMGRVNGGELRGCQARMPFALAIDGRVFGESDLRVTVSDAECEYLVEIPAVGVMLRFAYALEGQDLVLGIPALTETGAVRVQEVDFQGLWLVTGCGNDSYWRHQTRRISRSRHWCPGTATYDQWEEGGRIADGYPELGPQYSNHACVWNDKVCAGVMSSVHIEPLVTELMAEGAILHGRADQLRIRPGKWSYRLRGQVAGPLVVRVGILGDYDRNGHIDMFDAANWEGDRTLKTDARYHEAIVYKLFMDIPSMQRPNYRYADCLPIIRDIHQISGGVKQVVYLVGWQHTGHDTGYPCHTQLNPRLGTRDELVKLIDDARQYNAVVSLHANYDDSYRRFPEYRPELLSRDERGVKVWFGGAVETAALSISHTLANESGYNADRTRRLLELLPINETIHLDAHRPYNEVWMESGEHISAECEVQRGMIPLKKAFLEHGIDITTEDTDDEKRGIYHWVWIQSNWEHPYNTAMYHGRLPGLWRAGMPRGDENTRIEGLALGTPIVKHEVVHESYEDLVRCFYSWWMYAQLLLRKPMTSCRVGEWHNGIRATYSGETVVEAGWGHMRARYEGIEIARDGDRFLPWREDVIYAYSRSGGEQKWTLPASWAGRQVDAKELSRDGEMAVSIGVNGQEISWHARPGMAYRFTHVKR